MTSLIGALQGSQAIHRLGWTLLHTLWLGVAVAVLFTTAMVSLRRRSANSRYLVGCIAMVLMVVLSVAAFFVVPAPLELLPGPADNAGVLTPVQLTEPSNAVVPEPTAQFPAPAVADRSLQGDTAGEAVGGSAALPPPKPPFLTRASRALEPALPWVVLAWAVGVFLLSIWQLASWIATWRLKRLASQPGDKDLIATIARLVQEMHIGRPVKVLESMLVRAPTVIGWLRPFILLPLGLATCLTPEQLLAILAHELAHIRRYDYLVNLLQSLVETLLFYHPAVWFISRRIRIERENCCDDIVVAPDADRFSYAESLLHVAQVSAGGPRRLVTAAGLGQQATDSPSRLRSRIVRLLDGGTAQTTRLARSWPITMAFLAVIVVTASVLVTVGAQPHSKSDKRAPGAEAAAPPSTQPAQTVLDDRELEWLWKQIGSEDHKKAYNAMRELSHGGDRVVAFIRSRLELPQAGAERIQKLIAELNADTYAVRQNASAELALLGPLAEPALRKALAGEPSSEEARVRIEALLKLHSGTFNIPKSVWPVVRTMSVLAKIGTPAAREFLQKLKLQGSQIVPDVRYCQGEKYALVAGFVPDKVRYILGEPVFITFFVRNLSDKPYAFHIGGANRGSVRDNNFRITAVDGAGKPVKDPHSYTNFGGFGRNVRLKPGQVHTARLYLGHWCVFDRPGEYAVSCRRTLNDRGGRIGVTIASMFPLTIHPADAKKMREVIAAWGAALRTGDKDTVYEATVALAAINDEAVIPHLAESLKMKHWRQKRAAVAALSRFTDDTVADVLCTALKDPDYAVARDAGRALQRAGKIDRAVDTLLGELKAPEAADSAADRAGIVRALGYTGARRVGSTLVSALQDKDATVRQAAAEALGWLGYWSQIPTLKKCLASDDMGLRVAAVKALHRLEQPIEPKWLANVILAAKGRKRAIGGGKTIDDLPRSFHDATPILRMYCKDRGAASLVSCLDFDNPKVNSSYNFYIIGQIEGCKNGPPKVYSKGKYHHDANTEGTPEQIKDNRLALAELKMWLERQQAVKRPALQVDVKKALAEAMRIRIKHHSAGLAMWRELAALVKPGWTVQQMKLILTSPGRGGMSYNGRDVTFSYGVQENAFMVRAKGQYVEGASYKNRDGHDKIILTAPPTVTKIRRKRRSDEEKTGESAGRAPVVASPGEGAKRAGDTARTALLKAFKTAKYPWMQAKPAKELIALGDNSVVPDMLEILKSENRRRRCNAAWVLAGLGDRRGLAAVLSELRDTSERPTARIRSDGKPDVVGQIDSDRYYAAHVLGEIGDRRAVPALIETLRDRSIAYQSAIVLGKLRDPRAVPALKELLKNTKSSQHEQEWLYAGYALAEIGDPAGFPVLVEFLKSASWVRRRQAARALGILQDKRAVAPLVKALKDESVNVRVAAVKALGKLADRSAIRALAALSDDNTMTTSGKPTTVRDAVAETIRRIENATKLPPATRSAVGKDG